MCHRCASGEDVAQACHEGSLRRFVEEVGGIQDHARIRPYRSVRSSPRRSRRSRLVRTVSGPAPGFPLHRPFRQPLRGSPGLRGGQPMAHIGEPRLICWAICQVGTPKLSWNTAQDRGIPSPDSRRWDGPAAAGVTVLGRRPTRSAWGLDAGEERGSRCGAFGGKGVTVRTRPRSACRCTTRGRG